MKVLKCILVIILYLALFFVLVGLILLLKPEDVDINWIRNYYNIVSSITSALISITGIILGGFYYFDKERRSKTNLLIREIEQYDSCVKKILKQNIKDAKELKEVRTQINTINDRIDIMLDNGIKFITFNKKAISQILYINSIVDKSEVIMHIPFSELKKADLATVTDLYEDSLKKALFVCYGELK